MNNDYNVILDADSYKASHWLQYPAGTTSMFSYVEARGGKWSKTIFFGLQYYIKRYLMQKITMEMVEEAKIFYALHGVPFNYEGWKYIAVDLEGKLPVRIRAAKEGADIPVSNALLTIESTDPKVFWVASWLETMLLRVWYPINVATLSKRVKEIIYSFLSKTSEAPDVEIAFKLHDFGSRGVSSQESACIGGAAHLVNFMGSDTVVGVHAAMKYYGAEMPAFSIPAAEHSTITSWGREHEVDAYRNMLKQYAKPGSIVAIVSDSYDIYNAIEKLWGGELKEEVINSGATIVIRPDSGEPVVVVEKCLQLLEKKFGCTVNNKGFKVLNNVRIIQGDGVNEVSISAILAMAMLNGFSASNIAFGMGGALLQQHNRDTSKFAMKCSSVTINDIEVDVFKDPVDDKGKQSKKGRLDLIKHKGTFSTIRLEKGQISSPFSAMVTVFENGKLLNETTFDEIRKLSNS